jgi:hypothetical protein
MRISVRTCRRARMPELSMELEHFHPDRKSRCKCVIPAEAGTQAARVPAYARMTRRTRSSQGVIALIAFGLGEVFRLMAQPWPLRRGQRQPRSLFFSQSSRKIGQGLTKKNASRDWPQDSAPARKLCDASLRFLELCEKIRLFGWHSPRV